jgi:hypothetical protein
MTFKEKHYALYWQGRLFLNTLKKWFNWRVVVFLLAVFTVGLWIPFADYFGCICVGVCG